MERTKAMFETLLEERYATATRDLTGVYWRCRKEFLKLYEDLPTDDVERIAAGTFEKTLPSMAYLHPIPHKHIDAQYDKRWKADDDEINAKVAMEKEALDSLIAEYNKVLNAKAEYEAKLAVASKAIATHAATLNAAIKGEHSPNKRKGMLDKIKGLSGDAFAKLRPSEKSLKWTYARDLLNILQKGRLSTTLMCPKLA